MRSTITTSDAKKAKEVLAKVYSGWASFDKIRKQQQSAYEMFMEQMPADFKAQFQYDMFIPIVHKFVQAHIVRITASLETMKLRVFASRQEDALKAEAVNAFLNWQASASGYNLAVVDYLTNLIVSGVAWGIVENAEIARSMMVDAVADDGISMTKVSATRVLYSGPKFTPLKNQDVFYDPVATCTEDLRWVVIRRDHTLTNLKAINSVARSRQMESSPWHNLDKVAEHLRIGEDDRDLAAGFDGFVDYKPVGASEKDWRIVIGATSFGTSLPSSDDIIPCLELWDLVNWKRRVIAFGYIPIYDDQIPYSHLRNPFVCSAWNKIPFELYGKGSTVIHGAQRYSNAYFNLLMENIVKSMHTPIFYSEAVLKQKDFKKMLDDGAVAVQTDDVRKAVQQIQLGNPSADQNGIIGWREIQTITEQAGSTPNMAVGSLSSGGNPNTATEVSMAKSSLDAGINYNLLNIENTLTHPVSLLFFEIDKEVQPNGLQGQFLDHSTNQYVVAKPADFEFNADNTLRPIYAGSNKLTPSSAIALFDRLVADPRYSKNVIFDMLVKSFGVPGDPDKMKSPSFDKIEAFEQIIQENQLSRMVLETSPAGQALKQAQALSQQATQMSIENINSMSDVPGDMMLQMAHDQGVEKGMGSNVQPDQTKPE